MSATDDTGPAADRARMIQRVREHWLATRDLIADAGAVGRLPEATLTRLNREAADLHYLMLTRLGATDAERKLPQGL